MISRNVLIRASHIKAMVVSKGRRSSPGFIYALNEYVHHVVERCCNERNGGKKTLDRELFTLLYMTKR